VIQADGEDLSVITVAVKDAQNHTVPVATNLVQFELEGPGRILGVGNGDPSCHEPDVYVARWPIHTTPIKDWRWQKIGNPYQTNLSEIAERFDDSGWTRYNVLGRSGPLNEREHAVFRGQIELTEQDLVDPTIEMGFGNISGDGWVYVNGRKIGESHDSESPPVFDVKGALHPGRNSVVVVVANYGASGGISRGVTLQFQARPESPHWQRSAFNGLAQIIVQGTKQPGKIRLTARSTGLKPATTTIQSQACTPRPTVP
jgi:beta-galactosidase